MSAKDDSSSTDDSNFLSQIKVWIIDSVKRTFSGHDRITWIWILIFFLIAILSGIILIIQQQDETWLFDKVIRWFVIPIINLDYWGWIIFIIFMGIQGILIPIPSELVLLTSGLVWGVYGGAILGIIGSMVAGVITYYIAILGGRPMIEKFLGQDTLELIDSYIKKYGTGVIIFARAFPFMAFDPISYASGFLKIKFKPYFFATLLGSLIRCVFYAWLGSNLSPGDINHIIDDPTALQMFIESGSNQFNLMLTFLVVILGIAYIFYQFVFIPYLKRQHLENQP